MHALLQDGYIMVTWANHHYLDFAKSWVYHVKKAGVTGYMVGAMDDEILESLAKLDINTWRMNSGITKTDLGWGSQNFHKMGRCDYEGPPFPAGVRHAAEMPAIFGTQLIPSPHSIHIPRVKISLIKQFLELDVVVLISDIDTAWVQNPLPYFSRFPEAQILTSTGAGPRLLFIMPVWRIW